MTTKTELLEELDKYLALREPEKFLNDKTLSTGHTITTYLVRGIARRSSDRMDSPHITFKVYREGEAQELAAFDGDPLQHLWLLQLYDYLEPFQGVYVRGHRPQAICRLVEGSPPAEKWVLVTGTPPTEAPWAWTFAYVAMTIIEFVF